MSLGQYQRWLRINRDGTSLTTSYKGNDIDDDDNAIVMKAMTPASGRQCHHCHKGNNAVTDQGQQHHHYEGNDASLTIAKTPAH
jgi:hypothetical protein